MSLKSWWRAMWAMDDEPTTKRAPRLVVFKDIDNCWRYNCRGANGEIMLTSEAYASLFNAERAASELVKNPPLSVEVS